MVNKKITIILSVIGVLVILLLIGRGKRTADIPSLEKWEGMSDEILITKKDQKIRLYRKEAKWFVNDEGYPADQKIVSELDRSLNELNITDLISTKPYYDRYGLAEADGLRVRVKKDGKTMRDFMAGKNNPTTYKHSYFKFYDRPEIYMAAGRLEHMVGKTVFEFRDKQIFNILKEEMKSLSMSYQGNTITLTRVVEEVKDDPNTGKTGTDSGKKEDAKKADPKKTDILNLDELGDPNKPKTGIPEKKIYWVCKENSKIKLPEKHVFGILGTFNPVEAFDYPNKPKDAYKNRNGIFSLRIGIMNKIVTLDLMEQTRESITEDQKKHGRVAREYYLCTSSESPYVFGLLKSKVDDWFAGFKIMQSQLQKM